MAVAQCQLVARLITRRGAELTGVAVFSDMSRRLVAKICGIGCFVRVRQHPGV